MPDKEYGDKLERRHPGITADLERIRKGEIAHKDLGITYNFSRQYSSMIFYNYFLDEDLEGTPFEGKAVCYTPGSGRRKLKASTFDKLVEARMGYLEVRLEILEGLVETLVERLLNIPS